MTIFIKNSNIESAAKFLINDLNSCESVKLPEYNYSAQDNDTTVSTISVD